MKNGLNVSGKGRFCNMHKTTKKIIAAAMAAVLCVMGAPSMGLGAADAVQAADKAVASSQAEHLKKMQNMRAHNFPTVEECMQGILEAEAAAKAAEEAARAEEEARIAAEEKARQEFEAYIAFVNSTRRDGPHLTKRAGVFQGPSGKETYYNLNMNGVVRIMRSIGFSEAEYPYWVRDDGVKMLGPYVMVAAALNIRPRGSLVECSLGTGLVCDTGTFAYSNPYQLDIAVTW